MRLFSFWKKKQQVPQYEVAQPLSLSAPTSRLPSSYHFAIIRLRANAVASLTWNVYRELGNDRILVDPNEDPIAKVFWKPSSELTTTELLSNIVFFLDYYGNAFVRVKERDGFEIELLHPLQIQKHNTDYVYRASIIPKSEVIHIRNPILDWFGRANVSVLPSVLLREHNEALKAITNFILRFSERSGGAPLYLSGSNLTLEQQRNVLAEWNLRFPDFPLRMSLDSGEIKGVPVTASMNIDALADIVKIPLQALAIFYGVPLGKLTGENANYATAAINDYTFWTTSVKPTALLISDALTDYFRRFDETILISFEDVDFSVFEMFKEQKPMELVTKLAEDRYYIWKGLDLEAKKLAKNFEEPFRSFWNEFEKLVWEKVAEAVPTERTFYEVSTKIDPQTVFELLEQFLSEPLSRSIKQAILRAFRDLKQPPENYELIESKVWAYSEDQLKRWCEIWTRQIRETIELSQNQAQLEQAIEKAFQQIRKQSRIQMQARQIATIALNASLTTTYEQFPEYKVVWLSQRDGQVRPSHVQADGQEKVGGFFFVGGEKLPFPGGGVIAENNVNCRCYVRPVRRTNGKAE